MQFVLQLQPQWSVSPSMSPALELSLPPSTELLLSLPGPSASESLSDELSCFLFFVAFLSLPLLFAFFRSLSFFFLLFALASFFDPFFFFFFVAFLSGLRSFLPISSAFFARFSRLRFSH